MDKLILIIIFSFLGSVGSLTGAFLLLIFPDKVRLMLIPSLISYATGTLLASSLLGMIPKALVSASSSSILLTVLVGMISFFCLKNLSYGDIAMLRTVKFIALPVLSFF